MAMLIKFGTPLLSEHDPLCLRCSVMSVMLGAIQVILHFRLNHSKQSLNHSKTKMDPLDLKKSIPFVVQHVLEIDDVQSKIQERGIVTSAKFTCGDDPAVEEFTLNAYFGSAYSEPDHLSVSVQPGPKGTTFVSIRVAVVDLEGSWLSTEYGVRLVKTKSL